MNCEYCGNSFVRSRFHPGQKYCSGSCCQKMWRSRNPERVKEHGRKYRMKLPLKCRWCERDIPIDLRTNGVQYCSDSCREFARKEQLVSLVHAISEAYRFHKLKVGCQRCGYDRCAACLDYHHLFGKKFRIDAKGWYYQSDRVKEEMKKCVLLCKNCHYEVHNGFELDMGLNNETSTD